MILQSQQTAVLTGSYNGWLVAASLLMAMLASYTALNMAGRVVSAQGSAARYWLAGGSAAMGVGIWSMHFLGMLAFRLPVAMGYDPAITFASLLIAIASSAFALWLVCGEELTAPRLVSGALLLGAGVCAMHYTGMAAMRMTPGIRYIPSIFFLSGAIAVGASGAALWMAFHLRRRSPRVWLLRAGASVLMGCAIAGMHYTGMAAAQFAANSRCAMSGGGVTTGWMALLIIVFGGGVLAIALITSVLDLRLEMRTAALATSLADANRELQFLALHDSLTKLPNRLLLEDRLQQQVQNGRRGKSRFAVLFLDLDGFKEINDVYGHHIGDLLLVEVAGRIRGSIRASDTLARIGGDEFILIVDAGEPADAANVAEKLVVAIRDPYLIGEHELGVSASIGIAMFNGRDREAQSLLKNADAAMYHAKAMGRNCYCFFEATMNEGAQQQMHLLHDLRQATDRNELVLHYQPKFSSPEGELIGAEALLRWNHPVRGLVPPDQFIPLAEKTGLIISIGRWVLNEACRQMARWRASGFSLPEISVNLSAVQFNHPGMIALVSDTLQRYSLDPRCLTLEITESTAMRNADASIAILQQLHEMGVRISIDDFGTGYSSLLYLKRLSASELKIDRGFVQDLLLDAEDAAIVSAIVGLGRTLNLKVVAEGVETSDQREFLTRIGCNSLQGYLLGRPAPGEQFADWFRRPSTATKREAAAFPAAANAYTS
jgi:diguanylate cyclase